MSEHVEWTTAATCYPTVAIAGQFEDAYGTQNDLPVLLLGTDSTYAIEGTKDDLLALLHQCIAVVERDLR